MLKRVPWYRKQLAKIAANVAVGDDLANDTIKALGLPDNEATKSAVTQLAVKISNENEFPTRTHLTTLLMMKSSSLPDVITNMSWRFFIAPPEQTFLTGDNPVFFTKGLGLQHADAEVSFPISSQVCLVATNLPYAERFSEAPRQVVKELNRRTISVALEFVYSCQLAEWIVDILNKDAHQLHRIE
jgi:hypothetical protein